LACKSQFHFDQSIPTHRIGHQLADGQREPPATTDPIAASTGPPEYEVYVHAIQSGSTHGEPELCEVIHSFDEFHRARAF
jgi:hypothetical protein